MLERQMVEELARDTSGQRLAGSVPTGACKVMFVVPVRAEREDRVVALLQSLAGQDVAPGTVEVILVVNNSPDDGTNEWQEVFRLNQGLLAEELTFAGKVDGSELVVHEVDQSSPGRWVENCNVGMARQRGLLEATTRFVQCRFNGLLVHTDADCRFEDNSMVTKLLQVFDDDEDLVGMGGTYTYEIDVDDPESAGLLELLPRYRQWWLYDKLTNDIAQNHVGNLVPSYTLGRFIVHRAYQGYLTGGFQPIAIYEDCVFADTLRAYASGHGMHFGSGHEPRFGPVTALRMSDRTPNNIRKVTDQLDGATHVDDIFEPGARIRLTDAYVERLRDVVGAMKDGETRLHYLYAVAPVNRVRVRGLA